MEDVTPQPLRHTFGKNLVHAGVLLDRVAQLLGHESAETTRVYTTPRARRSLWQMGAGCTFGLSTSLAPVGVLDLHRSMVLIRPATKIAGHRQGFVHR
jgi:hypothetical protein